MPADSFISLTTQPPTPERREAARKVASLTLLVALVGVVAITCLVVVLLQRTRKRLTDGARPRRTRYSDAWAEAGRRVGAPPAEAFEPDSGNDRPEPPRTGDDKPGAKPGD